MIVMVESPGIEGNYDEILEWMDENPVKPVRFWDDRGSENAQGDCMEFGLFSIIEDADDVHNGLSFVSYQYNFAYIEGVAIDIEDPENSHRIIF